jgi:hypothetical protein
MKKERSEVKFRYFSLFFYEIIWIESNPIGNKLQSKTAIREKVNQLSINDESRQWLTSFFLDWFIGKSFFLFMWCFNLLLCYFMYMFIIFILFYIILGKRYVL